MFFSELIQFSEDGFSSWANSYVKTAQLGFCFLIGKPTPQNQLNLFWDTYLLFHRAKFQTTELSSACQEVNKPSDIWRHLPLVVLLNSGILRTLETAFLPPSTMTFWRYYFKILMSIILWPHVWDVQEPNYFYQIRLNKIGNALDHTGSAFLFVWQNPYKMQASLHHLCFLTIQAFFSWITFFTTVHC